MASTFTTNKGIEMPASGDYVNAWAAPVNADWVDVDTALGGTTSVSVTGVGAGTIALTLTQYRPPNIEFTGTLGANLNYQIPAGVGGIWTISNATSGAFTLQFSIAAGNALTLGSGRTLIVSDGVNVALASPTVLPSSITISGTMTAGAFNVSSDERLKKDISPIQNPGAIVDAVDGVTFTWIVDGRPDAGFIAQHIEAVLPRAVREIGGNKVVNPVAIIGVLWAEVKDLRRRIARLEGG